MNSNYKIIDLKTFNRKAHYEAFSTSLQMYFSFTKKLYITKFLQYLKEHELKFFVTFLFILTKVINSIPEFRHGLNEKSALVEYDFIHPNYNIFNDETKTFSSVQAEYCDRYVDFVDQIKKLNEKYKGSKNLNANPIPLNTFFTSSITWLEFENSSLDYLSLNTFNPTMNWSRITQTPSGEFYITFYIKAHHAYVDGYHMSLLLNGLQNILESSDLVSKIIS